MSANPGRERRFRQLATSEPQHCRNDLSFRRLEFVAIKPQKYGHRYEGYPLVPISVGMIPGQSVAVTSGKIRGINLSSVRPTMPWTCQCRLKRVLIPNPGRPPWLRKRSKWTASSTSRSIQIGSRRFVMGYFANSLRAFLYFRAACAAIASARSTVGS